MFVFLRTSACESMTNFVRQIGIKFNMSTLFSILFASSLGRSDLGVSRVDDLDKYLYMPIFHKRVTIETFELLVRFETSSMVRSNDTWELIDLPKGNKTIGVKWVYKEKQMENREVDKCKAQLVAKGYVGNKYKVFRLKKALYGLKQASLAWLGCIEDNGKMLILSLYVDDFIFTGNDYGMFDDFKKFLTDGFEMIDLEKMHYFLGLEAMQSDMEFLSFKKCIFKITSCNSTNTSTEFGLKLIKKEDGNKVDSTLYKQIVGGLMYLTTTRPGIMYFMSLISMFMESLTEKHLLAANGILRYL
ncbi:Retrovirus-related Pol polyprotein from transposon TNT 1-94 [Gossypium australe]|uniref:Retrovirus-related Pol polyprotein from transposon TNT 1-94 n=1 Tax=Gossypium australe TaxID=47621 RepID=A0A5B6V7G9_9ROSI|nr:Retrovirus-related Pol polyprotein from transposon TNT 1-94 [Gossypium australe]